MNDPFITPQLKVLLAIAEGKDKDTEPLKVFCGIAEEGTHCDFAAEYARNLKSYDTASVTRHVCDLVAEIARLNLSASVRGSNAPLDKRLAIAHVCAASILGEMAAQLLTIELPELGLAGVERQALQAHVLQARKTKRFFSQRWSNGLQDYLARLTIVRRALVERQEDRVELYPFIRSTVKCNAATAHRIARAFEARLKSAHVFPAPVVPGSPCRKGQPRKARQFARATLARLWAIYGRNLPENAAAAQPRQPRAALKERPSDRTKTAQQPPIKHE